MVFTSLVTKELFWMHRIYAKKHKRNGMIVGSFTGFLLVRDIVLPYAKPPKSVVKHQKQTNFTRTKPEQQNLGPRKYVSGCLQAF
ncbi:hypothetical protein VTN00DRAFT_1682 [Thermoascus crustaceus]|uniref:uncharacterized protein n=1 Tax=Thermoascus crustaceus TaxID=5088 RepID=UPI003743BC0B